MKSFFSIFLFPSVIGVISLALVAWGYGWYAFAISVLLIALEIGLSFDNAVVNAKVLGQMEPKWQQRFIIWGIPLAVFATRFVLPIFIVSISAGLSAFAVATLAFQDTEAYGKLVENSEDIISAFGGFFLLMVGLKYFIDTKKDLHWIAIIEKNMSKWGHVEAVEIAVVLSAILVVSALLENGGTILFAGIFGVVTYLITRGIAAYFGSENSDGIARAGFSLFVYLNVLDAAFSLDGVVGAFALSSNVLIIAVGLGIGALFVRSLTVYFVRANTLAKLKYLEHGAHWGITGLAFAMIFDLFVHVPEPLTGLVGIAFIGAAYYSSIQEKIKN